MIDRIWKYFKNYGNKDGKPVRDISEFQDFILKGQTYIPTIHLKGQRNYFVFQGESYHSYTREFFKPVYEYIEDYLECKPNKARFEFWYTYFNTSTSLRNLEILQVLDKYKSEVPSFKVDIYWYYLYNAPDIKGYGEEYAKELKNIQIQLVEVDDAQYDRMTKGFRT